MRLCSLLWVGVLPVIVCAAGCPQATPVKKAPPAPSAPLKLLVVDDQPLGEAIAREWQSRTEAELDVKQATLADIQRASRLPADIVVFPAGELGLLVQRELVRPLDEDALADEAFDRRDILDQVRLREMVWGNKTVAVPLGSPRLLVVYRRDVLDALGLAPPQTWQDYQALFERLAAENKPELAAIEPLADGWAGQMLLARAAGYVTHRDQVSPLFDYQTLEPLIASAPYVRALEELVKANQGRDSAKAMTPAEAWSAVRGGQAALAITWAQSAVDGAPAKLAEPTLLTTSVLGFAQLPGSREVYNVSRQRWDEREADEEIYVPLLAVSGRLAAATTTTADAAAAQNFLVWLAGRETSAAIAPASRATTLFRQSHLVSAGRFDPSLDAATAKAYWAALARACQLQRYVSLRLPGRGEYLSALDKAVHAALVGDKPPAEALAAADDEWRKITEKLGRAAQQRALKRELGQESLP
jgi:ABC-type glycerol-3-phosphate transport system substrate-binding protein